MIFFYYLRSRFRAWRYLRKYGIPIEEGVKELAKHVILTKSVKVK